MLISPTEPVELRALGVTSWVPEQYGADFIFPAWDGLVAVQRKTVADLLDSLRGDRLAREIPLLRTADHPLLLVEGRPVWTDAGLLLSGDRARWRREGWFGVLLSIQRTYGIDLALTDDIGDTAAWLRYAPGWFGRREHRSLLTRPRPTDQWGEMSPRDFAIHLLQSIPGIGPKVAESIYDCVGLPLTLAITERELRAVPLVGKDRAAKIVQMLGGAGDGAGPVPDRSVGDPQRRSGARGRGKPGGRDTVGGVRGGHLSAGEAGGAGAG